MKLRVRFGIRNGLLFPNAAVFILKMTGDQFGKLEALVDQLRAVLPENIAAKIVCEVS